jgi:arginyl-tRNA synthetase
VAKSQHAYAPHHVVGYLLELAREFNSWYGRERILDSERAGHFLAIVTAVGQVLKNGLGLLAIDSPSEM